MDVNVIATYVFGMLTGSQFMYGLAMSKLEKDNSYIGWALLKCLLYTVIWGLTYYKTR